MPILLIREDCPVHLTPFIHDLAGFEVLAGDGHWIGHASHDAPKRSNKGEETYYPVGHFYLLDLRRHTLRHLALCDQVNRRKEHDMRAIKRSGAAGIREGIPLGKKTILVWDPAGIELKNKLRQTKAWAKSATAKEMQAHPLAARPTACPVPVGRCLRPPAPDLREMLALNFGHRSVYDRMAGIQIAKRNH